MPAHYPISQCLFFTMPPIASDASTLSAIYQNLPDRGRSWWIGSQFGLVKRPLIPRSHWRSDQLDQARSIPTTHFYQSNPDQMLNRPSTRSLPDRYSIFYDPHPTIHDPSRTSPRQPHRSLLEHTDLHTINTRSILDLYKTF